MKQTLTSLLVLLIMGLGAFGCSSNDSPIHEESEYTPNDTLVPEQSNAVRYTQSGCKGNSNAATNGFWDNPPIERILYRAMSNGRLLVTHENTSYTCASKVKVDAVIGGDIIVITETDQGPLANCICAYDLTVEVGPLATQDYTLIVIKDKSQWAKIPITYSPALSGSFVCKNKW